MSLTLAFDVYGTLIDTRGVTAELRQMVGELADRFSDQWRAKQLEYSFRRGLMGAYRDFSVCTEQALRYTCDSLSVSLSPAQRAALMASYRKLPAFADVPAALQQLQQMEHRLYAFSNGRAKDVEALLQHSGIEHHFIDIISVDEVQSFKPDPRVYRHFLQRSQARPQQCWLISSNPFDLLGAAEVGFHSAWVRRSQQTPFDPWERSPTCTVGGLDELPAILVV